MITHKSPISGIATYGNKYIATAGYDNTIILWDAEKNESIARGQHDHLVNQCRFSHDGKYLVTSSSDYSARVWAVPTMKLVAILSGHTDDVEGLSFHPTSPYIATCSRDRAINIYDFDGKIINHITGHLDDIISVEWMIDSDVVVSSSDDGTIKYWNAFTGELIKNLSFDDVQTDTIAITSQGVIFAGNDNGEIVVINGDEAPTFTPAHKAGIKRLVYSEAVNRLISLSYDRTFKVWKYEHGELTMVSNESFDKIVWPRSCAFLNEDEVVFGTFGNKYARYSLTKREWLSNDIKPTYGINAVLEHNGNIYYVGDSGIVHENNQPIRALGSLCNFLVSFEDHIITGGQTGEIFDAITGEVYYQHSSPLNCGARFTYKGKPALVIGTYTGEGVVFTESEEGKVKFETVISLHQNAIKGISASDEAIFSVCATSAAAYHDVDGFECISYIRNGHDKIANGCVSIGRNGFASVSRDLHLRIWSDKDSTVIPTMHNNSIKCITSDATGRFLALGDYVGFVSVYDCEEKQWLRLSRVSDFGVSSLCFSPTNNGFIAGSYDGKYYNVSIN